MYCYDSTEKKKNIYIQKKKTMTWPVYTKCPSTPLRLIGNAQYKVDRNLLKLYIILTDTWAEVGTDYLISIDNRIV